MNVEKNTPTEAGSTVLHKTSGQEETTFHCAGAAYQKILDYHVSEILLTTIIIGVVVLLRLHH